ncbi:MAG: polyphenol oxidase family protein [Armatimonadota bacterium]
MSVWEHELSWPGVAGGFVGRSRRPRVGSDDPPDRLGAALATMGAGLRLVEAEQVHGARVARVTAHALAEQGDPVVLAGVDGLVTDLPGVALAIYVADCLAVWLHHPGVGVVGLAHAGWRGLAAGMPANLLRAALAFGGEAGELHVALSPCIRACCFEVGAEVAAAFEGIPGAVDRSGAKPHVDMVAVARWQLGRAGVPEGAIEVIDGCTRCEPERFASYRRDPEGCGRNVALIALRAPVAPQVDGSGASSRTCDHISRATPRPRG